jgi:hypothetical protein
MTEEQIAADPRYQKLIEREKATDDFYRQSGITRTSRFHFRTFVFLLLIQVVLLLVDRIAGIDFTVGIVCGTLGMVIAQRGNYHEALRRFDVDDKACERLSSELRELCIKHEHVPWGALESPEEKLPH